MQILHFQYRYGAGAVTDVWAGRAAFKAVGSLCISCAARVGLA
jgi:hypothetical protein